jgi:hypothetical protein
MKGRAVIDYLLDDVFLQKCITAVSIIAHDKSIYLLKKHITRAFPDQTIEITLVPLTNNVQDDTLILEGSVYTSLRLQDFIRFFQQYKTVTKAAYDKLNPKEIPFTIIPKHNHSTEVHTYNCGTGYLFH